MEKLCRLKFARAYLQNGDWKNEVGIIGGVGCSVRCTGQPDHLILLKPRFKKSEMHGDLPLRWCGECIDRAQESAMMQGRRALPRGKYS